MERYFGNKSQFLIEEHTGFTAMTNQHFHEMMEIYYLTQGEVAYFVDDTIYTIKEGNIIIIPPSVIHKAIDTNSAPRCRILLNLDMAFLDVLKQEGMPLWDSVSILQTNKYERIDHIFYDLLAEQAGEQDPNMFRALTCELLLLLHRKEEIKQVVASENAHSRLISEVVSHINQEYASELTLEQLAVRFFLSPSHLSRLFKKCTGLSFSDYLRKYRVKKAMELMADSRKNITQIALAVGFNSANHFCKTFKEMVHESPLQYRKRHLEASGDKSALEIPAKR